MWLLLAGSQDIVNCLEWKHRITFACDNNVQACSEGSAKKNKNGPHQSGHWLRVMEHSVYPDADYDKQALSNKT